VFKQRNVGKDLHIVKGNEHAHCKVMLSLSTPRFIAPPFLNLSIGWLSVVKFRPLPISIRETGKQPPKPVKRRLYVLQSWSVLLKEEKNLSLLPSIEDSNVRTVTQ
jgi:hypothetical protein